MSLFNPKAWTLSIKSKARHSSDDDLNTRELFVQAFKLRKSTPIADRTSADMVDHLIVDLLKAFPNGFTPSLLDALIVFYDGFADMEALVVPDADDLDKPKNHPDHKKLVKDLKRQIAFYSDYETNFELFRMYLLDVSSYIIGDVLEAAVNDSQDPCLFTTPLHTLLSDPNSLLDLLFARSMRHPLLDAGLFNDLQNILQANITAVSKLDPNNPPTNIHKYVMPSQARDMSIGQKIDRFFVGTPFHAFLNSPLPLMISDQSRLEHSYILAGSGHGKTQLMQHFLLLDLMKMTQDTYSIVVIDSQGDLISKLSHMDLFNPDLKGMSQFGGVLSDRIVIIDPNDIDYPSAINMFAMNEARMASYGSNEREKVQNSAIELYEHFFSELLGAELTAKQGTVFKYLARLMLEIPDATILTLRDLMEDGKPFIPYMDKLKGSARVFFAREFFAPGFRATKKQISQRLWGVLSTPAFERLFSSPTNKVDLFQLLNDGHIILINTAKDLLKEDGASLFGRFFISMLTQAIMERSVIPESERTPTFIYIDECQDYFDANIELLLAQGRKFATGLLLAHQHLDQLTPSERGSVLANTSIKLVGGVNAKDAKILATEMGCKPDFLQSMIKADDNSQTEFALWVRNAVREAVKVDIPIGQIESLPSMSELEFETVRARNRELYSWEYKDHDSGADVSFPGYERPVEADPKPEPTTEAKDKFLTMSISETLNTQPVYSVAEEVPVKPVPDSGRGGQDHSFIQTKLIDIAQSYGFKALSEHAVEGGYVDVWLEHDGRSIACEITVGTDIGYELGNIKKCLATNADEVWMISDDANKLSAIQDKLGHKPKVWFFSSSQLEAEIRARLPISKSQKFVVRGYEAHIIEKHLSNDDRDIRRARLDHVLEQISLERKS